MLKRPESMEECVYFTKRNIGEGHAMAWVFREKCEKCKKSLMGKPIGKNGKIKIRAKEYVCPECGYTVDKQDYEDSLTVNVAYTCPSCEHEGELQAPFKRKSIKGVQTIRVQCGSCNADIDITKKMKDPKK